MIKVNLIGILRYRAVGIAITTIGLFFTFYFLTEGRFFTPMAISSILTAAPEFGILAVGVTFLMISREFDLSVGAVFTFCSLMYALFWMRYGLNPILALLATLGVGGLLGALNGLITLKIRIPSIVTTLGTMYLWRGLALVICAGRIVPYTGGVPLKEILIEKVWGVPVQIIWFLIITAFFEIILFHHKFGNALRGTGGDITSAKEMGINTDRIKLICFVLVGILTAFGAIMEGSRIREGSARLGIGFEFYAIAAAVIGGTSLAGGAGTVMGTFFGAIIIQSIGTGLAVMGISGWWINVLIGVVIVAVVIVNTRMHAFTMSRRKR